MASMTGDFAIPAGFPEVLSDLAREILRSQPTDIHKFAAEYFAKAAASAGQSSAESAPPLRVDLDGLREEIYTLFNEADTEGKGFLSMEQARKVMSSVSGRLQLTDEDLMWIMSEADENDDGKLEYEEFLKLAMDVFRSMFAKDELNNRERRKEQISEVMMQKLHGLTKDELLDDFKAMFDMYDEDKTGFLSRAQFRRSLMEAKVGFTRKEINALMHQ